MNERIVEAYIGEYAGGKSENALNRALELSRSRDGHCAAPAISFSISATGWRAARP